MRRSSREEDPVARLQEEHLTADFELGSTPENDNPLVVVLVVVDRPVELAAQDLLDDRLAHLDELLNALATARRDGAVT